MPVPFALLASAIPALFQTGIGAAQFFKGNKMARNNIRPQYQIPGEIQGMLTDAQIGAMQGMPAEQITQYMNQLGASGNEQMRQIQAGSGGSAANMLQNITAVNRNQNKGLMDLLSANAQQRLQNMRYYDQARQSMAGFRDKQWELNKLQPFQDKAKTASALVGAGMQNFMGGLSTLGEGATTLAMNGMLGGGNGGGMAANPMSMPGRDGGTMGMLRQNNPYSYSNGLDYSPMQNLPPYPTPYGYTSQLPFNLEPMSTDIFGSFNSPGSNGYSWAPMMYNYNQ